MDLAVKLGCNFSYLRDVLSQLRAKDLVTRRSEGYDLSPRGATVVRELILKSPKDDESRFQKVRDRILKNKDQGFSIEEIWVSNERPSLSRQDATRDVYSLRLITTSSLDTVIMQRIFGMISQREESL